MLKTDYDIPIFKDEDIADLNEYSNEMASALKTQLDKFGNPLIYKGEVATLEDLPSEVESGHIYSVISENKNYIYNGTEWVEYSSTLDLTYLENNTKTTQTTDISETLTIENCAPVSAKLDIKNGKTIQEGEPSPDNIIPIRNVGDNIQLFDKNDSSKISITYSWNGSVISDGANILKSFYIPCKPNTTYTVKMKGYRLALTTTSEVPAIGVQTYGFVSNENITPEIKILSIITPSNAKYLYVNYYRSDKETLTEQEILDSIIVSEGLVVGINPNYNCGSVDFKMTNGLEETDENYKEQIKSFPFIEGQVLHKGDYLASDGIHQVKGTIDPTISSIVWYQYTNITYNDDIAFVTWNIPVKNDGDNINVLCNAFPSVKSGYSVHSENISKSGTGIFIRIKKSRLETQDNEGLKKFFADNNVLIEYDLAEEIVIPYTPEQKEAYYQLQHLLMYEGYTNITCIDEIKPDIQLTYWYNNELNKSYGERFDKVEDSINELENRNIYSTEEQVIGKWIDGKPLYKKVIVYTPTKIIGEKEKVTNIYIAHGISNFKQLCHQKCISSDGYTLPLLGSNTGSNIDKSTQIIQVAPDTICLRIINDTWGVRTWYITLEYTKTTD